MGNKKHSSFNMVDSTRPITKESIRKAYMDNGCGRCAFACDNDVVDHQTLLMKFANGVKANLTMTGFTALVAEKSRKAGEVCRVHKK